MGNYPWSSGRGSICSDCCRMLRQFLVALLVAYPLYVVSAASPAQKAAQSGNSTFNGVSSTAATCAPNTFRCQNGNRCIQNQWLCDGDNDCIDGQDEINCAMKTCGPTEFKCLSNNKCISNEWLCDYQDDCGDNSDELLAQCANRTCPTDQFQCPSSNVCIPSSWVCDTQKDCNDGSDEANCSRSNCTDAEFKCDNGLCITKRWVCDHDDDCNDGSDESASCDYTCSTGFFQCKEDKRCMPDKWRCDGDADCLDRSDEENCYGASNNYLNTTCSEGDFRCDDGVCIHKVWQCDGDEDCPDKSDEKHCENLTACTLEQYKCKGDRPVCIAKGFRCNGMKDCPEGDDEEDCPTTPPTRPCNPLTEFDCGGNYCIPKSDLCNRRYDCPKSSTTGQYADEPPARNCTYDPCKISNPCGANAFCYDTTNGANCSCKVGFKPSAAKNSIGGLVCDDVNECEIEPRLCSQTCHNVLGSYYCGCHFGYALAADRKTCKASGMHPKLWLSNRVGIREIDLRTGMPVPLLQELDSAVAMDYSFKDQRLIWSDNFKKIIYSCELSSSDNRHDGGVLAKTCQMSLVSSGLKVPDGLAVDWIHGLLYWTDTGLNTISVTDINARYRKTLFNESLDEPRAIAVDPRYGVMFWTDWGAPAKIERAGMDGTMRTVLIDKDIQWPNGLALDLVEKRIYWADAKLKMISSCDYDGQRRVAVLNSRVALRHPFSMTIFEDKMYWTDWDTEGVHSANKFTGSNMTLLAKGLFGLMTIRVYHKMSQPDAPNKCENSMCDHLCAPAVVNLSAVGMRSLVPYTCLCNDSHQLHSNGRSCIGEGYVPPTGSTEEPKPPKVPDQQAESVNPPGQAGPTEQEANEQKTAEPTRATVPKPEPIQKDGKGGHVAVITVAVLGFIIAVGAIGGYIIYRRIYQNPRRPKRLNFENPVYRRTVLDRSTGDQYDHLRLAIDSDLYHPNIGSSNGGDHIGSDVYRPTTSMGTGDAEAIGVGVVQNGKYSMKLPLTEHEEGPDFS